MHITDRARKRLHQRRLKGAFLSLFVAPVVFFVVLKICHDIQGMEIGWFYAISAAVFSVLVIFALFGASDLKELTCPRCGSVKVKTQKLEENTYSSSWKEVVTCEECGHQWKVRVEVYEY